MSNYFSIETERCKLRRLSADDISAWVPFFLNNPKLQFLGVDVKKTPKVLSVEWIDRQIARYEESGLGHLAITHKQTGEFMGVAGIIPREINGEKKYEIAYSLLQTFHQQGFATEVAQKLYSFGKENNISNSFICITHIHNYASQKVIKKLGFTPGPETTFLKMPVYIFTSTI